jgi:hypothetical protein
MWRIVPIVYVLFGALLVAIYLWALVDLDDMARTLLLVTAGNSTALGMTVDQWKVQMFWTAIVYGFQGLLLLIGGLGALFYRGWASAPALLGIALTIAGVLYEIVYLGRSDASNFVDLAVTTIMGIAWLRFLPKRSRLGVDAAGA